jgi:uncharacterized protein HemX
MANKKGLLALLGIGAGVFAWWKYKNLSEEEKEALKAKIDKAGETIKNMATKVEESVSETYEHIKTKVQQEVNDLKS